MDHPYSRDDRRAAVMTIALPARGVPRGAKIDHTRWPISGRCSPRCCSVLIVLPAVTG